MMALSAQNQNLISNLQTMAADLLETQREIDLLIAQWNQNDVFNSISDADIAAIPAFAHLTKSEVANSITAITAVTTALGDLTSGQAVNLLKMKG